MSYQKNSQLHLHLYTWFAKQWDAQGLRKATQLLSPEKEKLGDGTNYDIEIIRKRDRAFAGAVEGGLM